MKIGNNNFAGRALSALSALLLLAACTGSDASTSGKASGQASHATTADAQAAGHPERISQGEEIQLTEFAVEGEFTVFDFMSDYCPPCKQIAPWMNRLHAEREGVTVVKVDINRPGVRGIDWKSPVAAQFGLSSIPHFKVLDAEGNLVAEGDPAWEMLVAWLEELPENKGSGQG